MCKFSANVLFSYVKPLLFSFPLNSAHDKIISQILLGGGGWQQKLPKIQEIHLQSRILKGESCCILGLTNAGNEPQPSNAAQFITQLEYKGAFRLKGYFSNPLMKKLGNIAINSSFPL